MILHLISFLRHFLKSEHFPLLFLQERDWIAPSEAQGVFFTLPLQGCAAVLMLHVSVTGLGQHEHRHASCDCPLVSTG